MNTYFFKHEFLRIFKQKKNYFFVSFIFAVMMIYILMIMPTQKSIYSYDEEKAVQELKDTVVAQKGKEERDATGFSPMSGYPVYATVNDAYLIKRSKLYAFQDKSYDRFLRLHNMSFNEEFYDKIRPLKADSPFPEKDMNHLYTQTHMMYESYLDDEFPISYTMVKQTTSLQSLYHFLLGPGVFLLLFSIIYISSDMLVKDRKNKTILQGLPIPWYRLINLKSIAAVLYTLLAMLALTAIAMLVICMQNGFGSFSFKIPTTFGEYDPQEENYDLMKIGKFLLLCLAFLSLFIVLFTRLNMVFSLFFKNTWIVLILSSMILFMEQIYISRTSRDLFGIDIGSFPQTYFDFGNVITGERMFLLNIDSITYEKGFLIISISILVVEIILFLAMKIIGKRRFYKL